MSAIRTAPFYDTGNRNPVYRSGNATLLFVGLASPVKPVIFIRPALRATILSVLLAVAAGCGSDPAGPSAPPPSAAPTAVSVVSVSTTAPPAAPAATTTTLPPTTTTTVPPRPPLPAALEEVAGRAALVVGPGVKTGMAIRIDSPREVGADRVVNSVAARERYGAPVVALDFGTATTFDAVDAAGDYIGGVIAPGLEVSMEALVSATSALRRVDLTEPRSVIGKGTVEAIQSGLLYGYAGLVDGILARIAAETGTEQVVATGGLAPVIVPLCRRVSEINDSLTLEGLRLIWERNR